MPKIIVIIIILLLPGIFVVYYSYSFTPNAHGFLLNESGIEKAEIQKLHAYSIRAKEYCKGKGFNTKTCFFADMSLPAGKNRFFEYDMQKDSVINCGLVAHGSCNYFFLEKPKFSNKPGSGCTSTGKYKVGNKYKGKFGIAYKLYGLDSANSNAFKRNIVLHSYYLVPDKEVDPLPVPKSLSILSIVSFSAFSFSVLLIIILFRHQN